MATKYTDKYHVMLITEIQGDWLQNAIQASGTAELPRYLKVCKGTLPLSINVLMAIYLRNIGRVFEKKWQSSFERAGKLGGLELLSGGVSRRNPARR